MNRYLFLTALSLLGVGLLPAAASAQGAVEDVFPESSYAVVRFGGLERATAVGERLGLVRLGKVLVDRGAGDAFDQFVKPAIDEAASELRRELQHLGLSAGDLRGVLQRPMALGIGRPTLFGEAMAPSVGLVIDVGNRAEQITRVLGVMEAMLLQTEPDISAEDLTLEGHRVRALSSSEMPGNIVMGRIGDYMVVTNSRGYFRDCARVIAGQGAPVARMGEVRRNLPEPAILSAYVNTDSAQSVLDPFLPYEATEIGEGLGIQGLSGFYLGASGSGAGSAEVLHLGLTGSERGILRAPIAGPVSLDAARYCSEDTVLFGAASLDLAAFLEAGERMITLLPRDMRAEVHDELGRELRQSGMEPEQLHALMRAIGPTLSVAFNIPQQPIPIPEVLAFLEIRDLQAIEPLLGMVMAESDLEWKSTTSRDREIKYANVNADGVMFSPCFTIDDGTLLVSSHVRTLKAALAQRQQPESLATQPSFVKLAQEVGDATALLHARGNKLIELTWPMLETQLGMVIAGAGRDYGLNSDVIPESQDLSAALGTSTLSLHVDDTGFLLKQSSNTGLGAGLAGALMFFDAVLQAAQGRVF